MLDGLAYAMVQRCAAAVDLIITITGQVDRDMTWPYVTRLPISQLMSADVVEQEE